MSDELAKLRKQCAKLGRRVKALERACQNLHDDYERDIGRLLEHRDTVLALLPELLREQQQLRKRPGTRGKKSGS